MQDKPVLEDLDVDVVVAALARRTARFSSAHLSNVLTCAPVC
jgi:ATP-dependent Zn protease